MHKMYFIFDEKYMLFLVQIIGTTMVWTKFF